MTMTMQESLTLNLAQEVDVRAPLEATFEALLTQMGPENETPDGKPLPMILEPHPGGRWFRDLGSNAGHLWGLVQAIKRPTLIEVTGPLFMSLPVVSHLQYRLKADNGGTLISFKHSMLGFVPDEYRQGLTGGWTSLFERVRRHAEQLHRTH